MPISIFMKIGLTNATSETNATPIDSVICLTTRTVNHSCYLSQAHAYNFLFQIPILVRKPHNAVSSR